MKKNKRKKRDIILNERYIQARFHHLIQDKVCLLCQGYGVDTRDENEKRLFAIGYSRWDAGILANSLARHFKRKALAKGEEE
jgi:putative AlgH/UPF0301 family transcriptional regulator